MAPDKDLYGIIVGMNGRLMQSLQIAADTKDDVSKIKDIQAKAVTEQAEFRVLLGEHLKDHKELKEMVAAHDKRIKALEDDFLVRKKAVRWMAVAWGGGTAFIGWILSLFIPDMLRKWF